MALTEHRLTAEEYFALPPSDEHRFTQLIDGALVMTEASLRHQGITGTIYYRLRQWTMTAIGRGLAGLPVDVVLDDANVFAPDVWWVAEEHRPTDDAGHLDGPPDLAVEVRSPSTWRYDIGAKKATYERAGLPELWLVDTDAETVLVFRGSSTGVATFDVALECRNGDVLTSPLLAELSLPVAELFAR